MLRHSNNAIIITSVQGEAGIAGFQGAPGIACYTGTGDPNTLGLVAPTYTDPTGYTRGAETVTYQDTVTGAVWTATVSDGFFITPIGGQTWTKTSSVKGPTGNTGPSAFDKVEVNLGVNNGGGNSFKIRKDKKLAETEIARVIFPGTDSGTFTTVKAIINVYGFLPVQGTMYIKDDAGTEIASVIFTGMGHRIENFTITGTLPTEENDLYLSLEASPKSTSNGQTVIDLQYLLIT